MLGLFGTIDLARRSLQTQQAALEITGHNLANAANPAYARQRLQIQSSPPVPSGIGPEGAGADGVAIQQLRSALLDTQIVGETSVTTYLQQRQSGLRYAQTSLGENVDRTGGLASSTLPNGIAAGINDLFAAFENLSTDPGSLATRHAVLGAAADLATRFNQTALRLDNLRSALDQSLTSGVAEANQLIAGIAELNDQIITAEVSGGFANDLRDLRQQKLETLAGFLPVTATEQPNGALDLSVGGVQLLDNINVLDTIATYDAGGGQLLLRAQTGGVPITPGSGSLQASIETRDGELATLAAGLDTLATQLITQINTVHATGFNLAGGTGADFFTGADARTIAVNATLAASPSLLQASGAAGAAGDNQIAIALARLATQPQAALGNQTFAGHYAGIVTGLGRSLASVNGQLDTQQSVASLLHQQRESVSGVSVDEETTNLVKFQHAFEASARVVTAVDEMLDTVLQM